MREEGRTGGERIPETVPVSVPGAEARRTQVELAGLQQARQAAMEEIGPLYSTRQVSDRANTT